jgi:hypothetical protein
MPSPFVGAIQYTRLKVESDYRTPCPDALCYRNRETPWATPGIKDYHTFLKVQMFDYEYRTIGLCEGIIHFNKPMEPCRTRQLATTRSKSPNDPDGYAKT